MWRACRAVGVHNWTYHTMFLIHSQCKLEGYRQTHLIIHPWKVYKLCKHTEKPPEPHSDLAHLFPLLERHSALTPNSLVHSLLTLKNQFENNSSRKLSQITSVPELAFLQVRLTENINRTVMMPLTTGNNRGLCRTH